MCRVRRRPDLRASPQAGHAEPSRRSHMNNVSMTSDEASSSRRITYSPHRPSRLWPTHGVAGPGPGCRRSRGLQQRSGRAPRTPDGQPDLQGYWTNSTYTPLERPNNVTKEFYTEEELSGRQKKNARSAKKSRPSPAPLPTCTTTSRNSGWTGASRPCHEQPADVGDHQPGERQAPSGDAPKVRSGPPTARPNESAWARRPTPCRTCRSARAASS